MPKQNYSVDDILNEYSGGEEKAVNESSGKAALKNKTGDTAAYKIHDTGVINTSGNRSAIMDATITYKTDQLKNASVIKKPSPSHRSGKFAVSDIDRPNVSFISSVMDVNKNTPDLPPRPTDSITGYDGAVVTQNTSDDEYIPKVRKMSDSTRARELRKRRRKRKKGGIDFTYERETPDGVYIKPEKKKKKFVIQRESAEEHHKKPNGSIDFSRDRESASLDIHIPSSSEDHGGRRKKIETSPNERGHIIKDYDSFEDAKEIKRDIADLKGSISFRIMVLLIMALLSTYMCIGSTVSLPVPSMLDPLASPGSFAVIQLIIGLFSIVISAGTIKNGIINFFKFNCDCDSAASLAAISSAAAALGGVLEPELIKTEKIHLFMPVAVICLLINASGKYLILKRAMLNFDFVSRDFNCHAVVCAEDDAKAESLTRGTIGDFPILATLRKTNFITDFSRYTYSTDSGDRLCRFIVPVLFAVSALSSVLVTIIKAGVFDRSSVCFGISFFSMIITACCCMAMPLIANIPLAKAAKKYVRNHGVLLGYQSVEDFYDTNSILLDVNRLFPAGTVNLCSIKLFSDTKIDEALIEAASLTNHANSVLKELFNDIISGKQKILYNVENYVYEESMGICGWINNRRILLGNRELMQSHNIEGIPTKTKENEFTEGGRDALYLSVSGNLSAMFIIEINASPAIKKCMARMEKHDIAVILKSVDPFITISRLSTLFDYPDELLKIVPLRMMKDFDNETRSAKKLSASMACTGKFTSFVQLLLGTKSIRKTVSIGGVLQTASALLGLGIVGIHCILKAFDEIDVPLILGYNLICTAVTYLFIKLRKV
ncbi:MAG: hypothetical protein ACI4I9_06195 [Porcipelethomonas sp.]